MKTKQRDITAAQMERVAEILKTLGHPVRLQIMEALEQEEPLAVTDIQQRISIKTEQSMLSHHLIKMKDRGILVCEKQGMNVFYSIKDRNLLHLFDCMESCCKA
jgi:DNA-binding transcriptional ArsR family regulator